MALGPPSKYRLTVEQDRWLRQMADAEGHGNKSIVLRRVLDQARGVKRKPIPVATAR